MMKNEKNKKPKDMAKSITAPLSSFHLEVDPTSRGMSLLISGVLGINDFTEGRIMLLTRFGSLILEGRGLELSIYENGTVGVVGKVEEVRFSYGKDR